MTFEQALQIKTEEVTKDSYRCFDDLLHTHSHKGWLLQVIEEAAEIYAKSEYQRGFNDAVFKHANPVEISDDYKLSQDNIHASV